MGLEHKNDSATEAPKESGDFAAGLSAQQWSADERTTANTVAKPAKDSVDAHVGNLTIDTNTEKKSSDVAVKPSETKAAEPAKTAETAAKPADSANPTDAKPADKPDGAPKVENPNELREANSFLFKAADSVVHQSIYKLPKYITGLPKPSPDLGCVSSFSDRYREALKMSGVIDKSDAKEYRELYQVNMDQMNKVMGLNAANPEQRLLKPISINELKEGDIVEGKNPGTTTRHVGIVGGIENGKRMVYDNYGGTWKKEPLDDRFGRYKQEDFFRAYLPPVPKK